MSDLTIFPADLAAMSIAQLSALERLRKNLKH